MAAVSDTLPIFVVTLAGKLLSASAKARISEFAIEEREKQIAEVKLSIALASGERVADFLPKLGDKLRVRWGYVGAVEDTGELRVHVAEPKYGETTKIEVSARDGGAGLGRAGAMQIWEKTTIGDVVTHLAKQNGLTAVLPLAPDEGVLSKKKRRRKKPGPPEKVQQAARTPRAARESAILQKTLPLAQQGRTPWQLHVKDKELRLLPKHYAMKPAVTLRWHHARGRLLEFGPKKRRGGRHQAAALRTHAAGVDEDTGKPISVTVDDSNQQGRPVLGNENPNGGPNGDGKAPGGEIAWVNSKRAGEVTRRGAVPSPTEPTPSKKPSGGTVPTPTGKSGDAKDRAESKFRDAESGNVKTSFRVVGNPLIRKGRVIEVRDIDPEHCGLWMVTSSHHKIGETYEVTGEVRRHGGNKVKNGTARTKGQPVPPPPGPNPSRDQRPPGTKQVYYLYDSKQAGEPVGEVLR
jgi:hypothetical protein